MCAHRTKLKELRQKLPACMSVDVDGACCFFLLLWCLGITAPIEATPKRKGDGNKKEGWRGGGLGTGEIGAL